MKLLRIALFTALFLSTGPLQALTLPSSYEIVVGLILKQEYDYARLWLADCSSCTSQDSLYYSLLIENGTMVDYESYALAGPAFLRRVDKATPILQQSQGTTPRYRYYVANLLGSAGLVRVKTGDLMGGSSASRQSVRILKEIVQKDATFSPAYLGIGLYTYYVANSFGWVPFAGNGKDDGIILIKKSTAAQKPSSYLALQSLFWVYMDEKRYDDAEKVATRFRAVYPENTLMLRGLVALYMRTNRFEKALPLATQLQDQASSRLPINWADFFSGGRSRAVAMRNRGEVIRARSLVDSLLAVPVPVEQMQIEWVDRHVKGIMKLQRELQ